MVVDYNTNESCTIFGLSPLVSTTGRTREREIALATAKGQPKGGGSLACHAMDAHHDGWHPENWDTGGVVDRVSLVISLGFRPLRLLEYMVRTADHDLERALLKMPDNLLFWQ